MADTTALKNRIRAAIKTNDNQEITGSVLQQALLDIVDELNGATETETSQRQSADSTLTGTINTERSRAQEAEDALSQRITDEKNRAEEAESTLQQNITTEKTRVEEAIRTVVGAVESEISRAKGAENTLDQKISDETTRAQNALENAINTEKTRVEEAIRTVVGAVESEISRAKGAENTLDQKISDEKTRAKEAENALDQKISAAISDIISRGYVYKGLATSNVPSRLVLNSFYVALPGNYTGYFATDINVSGLALLLYTSGGAWSLETLFEVDDEPTQGSANHLTSGAVYSAIEELNLKKLEEVPFVKRRFSFRSTQTTVNEVATLPNYLAGIKLEVKPGDAVYLTATGEWDYSTWCFADSDKKTLTWSTRADTPCDNTKLVAPSNAKYFYANTVIAVEGHCWVEVSRLDDIENHNSQQDDAINETISIVNGLRNDTSGLLPTIPFLFKSRLAYNDIAALNIEKESMLYALGWYASKKGSIYDSVSYGKRVKRLTFGWITDIHGDTERFRRFMEYCNRYSDVIDAVLITGDMNTGSDIDYGWMETIGKFYKDFNMPILPILGNHDMAGDIINQSGNNGNVVASGSHENNDSYLFSPYIPSGAVKGPGSYYYLDFPEAKIRVIVLFEYELPIIVNCTAFEPLTDAEQEAINAGTLSYKNIVRGKSYSAGEILHYKGLYFKAKNDKIFNDIYGTGVWTNTPISQYPLWAKHFSQTQCDWLIASLKTTPQNYNVIVCSHGPIDFVETTPVDENWQTSNFAKNLSFSQNGYVLQDILSAFNNKSSINKTYKAIAPTTTPLSQNVTFINDSGNHYPDVVVNDDLSSTNGKAIAYLHGHWHADMNFFSGAMSGGSRILDIGNTCGVADSASYLSDLNRGGNKSQDAFNVVSFDTYNQTVQLLRIGADINDQMKQRLYTQLNY